MDPHLYNIFSTFSPECQQQKQVYNANNYLMDSSGNLVRRSDGSYIRTPSHIFGTGGWKIYGYKK